MNTINGLHDSNRKFTYNDKITRNQAYTISSLKQVTGSTLIKAEGTRALPAVAPKIALNEFTGNKRNMTAARALAKQGSNQRE